MLIVEEKGHMDPKFIEGEHRVLVNTIEGWMDTEFEDQVDAEDKGRVDTVTPEEETWVDAEDKSRVDTITPEDDVHLDSVTQDDTGWVDTITPEEEG